jgi:hypothetical protein
VTLLFLLLRDNKKNTFQFQAWMKWKRGKSGTIYGNIILHIGSKSKKQRGSLFKYKSCMHRTHKWCQF